jgi:hypothetical protein
MTKNENPRHKAGGLAGFPLTTCGNDIEGKELLFSENYVELRLWKRPCFPIKRGLWHWPSLTLLGDALRRGLREEFANV